MAPVAKNPLANAGDVRETDSIPGWGRSLEEEMATHSSILAWRILCTEKPGGLLSLGSHRVGHDWSDLAAAAAGPLTFQGYGSSLLFTALLNFWLPPTWIHIPLFLVHAGTSTCFPILDIAFYSLHAEESHMMLCMHANARLYHFTKKSILVKLLLIAQISSNYQMLTSQR